MASRILKNTKVEPEIQDEGADPAELPAIEPRMARPEPKDQVEWLLKFAHEDLGDKRLPKEILALGKEAGRVFGLGRDLQPGELRQVHRETLAGLEALRHGQDWIVKLTKIPTAVLLPPPRGRAKRGQGGAVLLWRPDAGHPIDRFLLQALRALDAAGDRFRLCAEPGCPEFFVARKRQELCSVHANERLKSRQDAVRKRRLKERSERKRRERRVGRVAGKKAPRRRRAKAGRRAR